MPQSPRLASITAFLLATISILSLAIPLYVIRPFRPQGPHELSTALAVRNAAPTLSAICTIAAILLLISAWSRLKAASRTLLTLTCLLALVSTAGTHINIFERMFHPYPQPVFQSAADSPLAPTDRLLSLTIDHQNHAYPIRTMGYHHIVNDTLASIPVAATYCTLCHTGLLWDRRFDGQVLYFTLAGINNGNALMRDRNTGTIWQQSTGEAIFGPLKGRHLTLLPSDELSFAVWRTEQPSGLILRADPANAADYDPADWEAHIERTHVVIDTSASHTAPHTLILGLAHNAETKAYPIPTILAERLIQDRFAAQPILILVGPDATSIRVFSAQPPAQPTPLTFSRTEESSITDHETASTWNFSGCATSGPLTGTCLPTLEAHKDYWFDWLHHNPSTRLYAR